MKKLLLIVGTLLIGSLSYSQGWEVGILGGVSNYQGDLSPAQNFYSVGPSHAAFGGFVRYNPHRLFAGRLGVNYSSVSGDDSKSLDANRQRRNLSFKSTVLEFNLIGEFNILGYQPYALSETFSPYVFIGVAGFVFNPTAVLDGDTYELQPLGTEGQGLPGHPDRQPYRLTEFAIPFGGGLKYAINDRWNIGIEVGLRKTFTDYLDDVSTTYVNDADILESRGEIALALANRSGVAKEFGDARGGSTNSKGVDDWYSTAAITISYNFLDNGLVGSRSRGKRGKKGCPSNF